MPTRNVVLTNDQASFVERRVSNGRSQKTSEGFEKGLRLVEQRKFADAARLVALRGSVSIGITDFDEGRYSTFESGAELKSHLPAVASTAISGA